MRFHMSAVERINKLYTMKTCKEKLTLIIFNDIVLTQYAPETHNFCILVKGRETHTNSINNLLFFEQHCSLKLNNFIMNIVLYILVRGKGGRN